MDILRCMWFIQQTNVNVHCFEIYCAYCRISNCAHIFYPGQRMNRLNKIHRTPCQFCFFDHADPKRVIIHMLNKHRQDASFTVKCIVKECFYSAKTWAAYTQHCKHKHNLKINNDNIVNVLGGDNIDEEPNYGGAEDCAIDNNPQFNENILTGKYILSLEAAHKVSSTGINSIVSSTGSLLSDMVKSISDKLLSIPRLQEFEEDILDVFRDFNSIAGFNELLTH